MESNKASACMDVMVGHFNDPVELPGLAHFCEHMLFLGTRKYPEESEYKRYITANGGSCNASTSMEHTSYHFEIASNALDGILDRFAQFFIHPLFEESATNRELEVCINGFISL